MCGLDFIQRIKVIERYWEEAASEMDDKKGLVPTIVLRGTAEERGRSHGRQLRERVHATWEWYHDLFKHGLSSVTEDDLEKLGAHFRDVIMEFEPAYCEEIEGIAYGSGLEAWKIYCINSRTELMYRLKREARNAAAAPADEAAHDAASVVEDDTPNECTSLFCAQFGVLAQNWDWCEDLESLITLFDHVRDDGHSFVTICEPGMLGKFGVSSAGVGCLLNAMDCGKHLDEAGMPPLNGVPIHILLRAALDAPNVDAAIAKLTRAPKSGRPGLNTSSHILVGGKNGTSALIEYAGKTAVHADVTDATTEAAARRAFRVHTNHYLQCGLAEHDVHGFAKGAAITSSRGRYLRALALVDATPELGNVDEAIDRAKVILGDTQGHDGEGNFPICIAFKHNGLGMSSLKGKTGTVATAVMDLHGGTMHYTKGNPLHHEYTAFTIGSGSSAEPETEDA